MFKSMKAEDYVAQRVDQFQGWYDAKAVRAKATYLQFRIAAVVGAVLVPVAANSPVISSEWRTIVTTFISLVVSVVVALDSVYHFGDQWRNYRSTEQFLSREKFLFQTGEGPYKDVDLELALQLLVERCEAQISAENSATLNVIVAQSQQQTSPLDNPK
jgi:hypothetical protein